MNLRSGYPFWLINSGLLSTYPTLKQDVTCEVVVIGGGITGALISHRLAEEGVETIVVDKRELAWGSTSASTAMLQYEIDKDLCELVDLVGEEDAMRAYQLGAEAIQQLVAIAHDLQFDCDLREVPSIYAATDEKACRRLNDEATMRRLCGLELAYVEAEELRERYRLTAPAAIVSAVGAALDPFRFTHALFAHNTQQRGVRLFDRTEIVEIEWQNDGVRLRSDGDVTIRAKKVVFATGYETQTYLKQQVVSLHSSYALVSEPVDLATTVGTDYLLWETDRPYFYMRTAGENRLLMGGADVPFRNPIARDKLIEQKERKLIADFQRFYPQLPAPEVAFTWAGTFGETKDGLAYIGRSPEIEHAYFALGYGGNGITYSMIAANIIADLHKGRANKDAHIFRFDR